MTTAGLLNVKMVGRQKQYQVNKKSQLYNELKLIVLKTFGLSDTIKHALSDVEDKIQIAFIFGSIAKKEDRADSGIDLMLIGEHLSYTTIFSICFR